MGKKILGMRLSAFERNGNKLLPGAIGWALVEQNEDVEIVLSQGDVLRKGREIIGIYFRGARKSKGLGKSTLSDKIESGAEYSIDEFLMHIRDLDCYLYIADRNGEHGNLSDLKKNA